MEGPKELVVKLFVGDVLVDQSNDVVLWQRVLSEIKGLIIPVQPTGGQSLGASNATPLRGGSEPVAAFAEALGVSVDELVGALDPQSAGTFVSLDERSWEALKKNTPGRGQGSISQTALAATALVLWQKYLDIGDVSVPTIKAVMATIDLDDPNVNRSIANCDWLQMKGSRVVLNPSRRAAAVRILNAYCRRVAPAPEG